MKLDDVNQLRRYCMIAQCVWSPRRVRTRSYLRA